MFEQNRLPPKRRVGGSNPLRDVLELWNDLVNDLDHSIFCLPGFLSFRNEMTANK